MKISDSGIAHLKQFEGVILFAYDDFDPPSRRRQIKAGDVIKGTLTIGYGHTGNDVRPGQTITQVQAENLLRSDLIRFERAVNSRVKVELTQSQFDALVSFAFNVGVGNFESSTLLKKLNAGNYDAVPGELSKWTKSKGKVMTGLVNRRAAEAGLWARGAFVQSSGSIADKVTPPLASKEAVTTGVALVSGGALQYVPTTGPLAYALAAILIGAAIFGLYLYINKRRGV